MDHPSLNVPSPNDPVASRRGGLAWMATLALLLVLLAIGLLTWRGWTMWQQAQSAQREAQLEQATRDTALSTRLDTLRGDQRAQVQRMQQAEATNRLLRDELLGLGQRAALLEESVTRLADPERHGAQALRLDEVELLLSQGQQRLLLSGDLDGARRAYALAGGLLDGVQDPAYLNLRQALVQERAMLEALGADPKILALGRLEAFAATLPMLKASTPAPAAANGAWWQRAFARVIDVRPSNVAAVAPGDRSAGLAALQLELALARAAAERRDQAGYAAALLRADAWMPRLWPGNPALQARRAALAQLRVQPLHVELPTLGTTLQQLRALRVARR